jgi:hypothetical protein
MCIDYYDETHPSWCQCSECMPQPNYWNGIDPLWHDTEMQHRVEAAYKEDTGTLREWGF